MTNKFKIGDSVCRTPEGGSSGKMIAGEVFTIENIDSEYYIDKNGHSHAEQYLRLVDTNIFPAGAYVVLLSSCNGSDIWDAMPHNYCFQLREDSTTYKFRVTLNKYESTVDGWYTDPKSKSNKLKLRAATRQEINEYIRLGKPFDVTNLSQEYNPIINNYTLY